MFGKHFPLPVTELQETYKSLLSEPIFAGSGGEMHGDRFCEMGNQ